MPSKTMLLDSYIYISHLDEGLQYWNLPTIPDTLTDTMSSTFASSTALGRSAPVYTFSNAGPRTVQINLHFHRDMLDDINTHVQTLLGEDSTDALLRALQSIAVPKYNLSNKAVEPPLVAVRFGEEMFIKGVVTSGITVSYGKPILYNNKWADITIGFTVSEVDPYDATTIFKNGSFRGLVKSMKKGFNVE